MIRVTATSGLLATALLMSSCRPTMEAQSPAPAVATVPAAPLRDPLWDAAEQVLSATCGNSKSDPGYQEHAQMLKEAGPAVVPILTAMVADKSLSVFFVNRAARTVLAYPFSEAFREALRARRDDPDFQHDHGSRLGVFDYFAAFGDAADLDWMVGAVEKLDETRRPYADKPIGELRRRLGQ